jgi:hypothetical protein
MMALIPCTLNVLLDCGNESNVPTITKKRRSIYSMHGSSLSMSQSGQLKENQGTSKIVLKLTMVLMQLPPMQKGHQEERLRRR